jgi:hypothetical protein
MADSMRPHIGDPNTNNIVFFVPGGNQNGNTFGVFAPDYVPDSAGPKDSGPTSLATPLETTTPPAYGLGAPVDPLLAPPPPTI